MASLVRNIFMGTGGAVIATYGVRKYREFALGGREEGLVHQDRSIVKIPIKSQVPATVQIVHPAANTPGKTSVTVIDKEKVSAIPVLKFYLSFLFPLSEIRIM